jgi:uncharacterized protein YlxW (UPF0749 family)
MKQFFLAALFAMNICGVMANEVVPSKTDSVQMKQRIAQLEKQLTELQAQVKTLQVKATPPAPQPKKLVIDRRGSKQAHFQ